MKRIFPLSLVLILCAAPAFSQQNQLIQGGNKSARPAVRAQDNAQPLPVQSGGVVQPSTPPVKVADTLTLQWELVNPFRFISDTRSMDDLRSVYDRLILDKKGEKTAYNLERALQKLDEDEVDIKRAEAGNCDSDDPKDRERCFAPYRGWFARLAKNNYENTCWDAEQQRFRDNDKCKNYIHPESHKVRVWISNSQLLGGRTPEWLIDNQPLTKFKNCDDKYQKGVCVEFDVEYDEAECKSREISVRFSDGSFTIASIPVLVKDKLIVGLGDSYASGEGNPDIPAQFTQGAAEKDFLLDFKLRDAPRKDKNTDVAWLDRRCHRSMYSYQFKTALQLALANQQEAITYVSYSCSGGTTDNIIDKKQKPNEGKGRVTPQLEALRKVLGYGGNEPRKIDYLLLSTGGNDIGFGRFVAYVVTSGAALKIIAAGLNETKLSESAQKFKETLLTGKPSRNKQVQGNYPKLHAALLDKSKGIKIKGCKPGEPCERILLMPYPNIFRDQNGTLCTAAQGQFDSPFGADSGRAARINLLKLYVFDPLNNLQLHQIPRELGWTIVKSPVDEYLEHGFCAQKLDSKSETAEELVIPTRKNGVWKDFHPQKYRAYETRQRWVRLPVDAKLTTDQMHVILKKIKFDLLLEDDRSNIMHPTAEGLTTHADANFKAIQKLEGKTN